MAGRYLRPEIQKNKRGEGRFKSQTNRRSQTHGPRPHFQQQLGASIRPQLWPRIPPGARTQHPPEPRRPSPALPARFSQRLGPSTRCHASCSSRALSTATLRAILPKPTVPAQGPSRGLPESHLPSKRMRQARDLLRTLKVGASGKGDSLAWPRGPERPQRAGRVGLQSGGRCTGSGRSTYRHPDRRDSWQREASPRRAEVSAGTPRRHHGSQGAAEEGGPLRQKQRLTRTLRGPRQAMVSPNPQQRRRWRQRQLQRRPRLRSPEWPPRGACRESG